MLLSEITYGLEIATFVIVLIGAIYAVYFWWTRKKEKEEYEKLMEDPLEMHFLIPSTTHWKINYAKQDDVKESLIDELILPVNFEDYLFLHIKPKLNLKITQRYFGFEGTGTKPKITYSNPFRKEGSDTFQWYRDWHGYYHIMGEVFWLKDEVILPAFKIETQEKGIYELTAIFYISSNEWKDTKKEIGKALTKKLTVRVQ